MANARSHLQLSEERKGELLEDAPILPVASVDGDDSPHLSPMWFATDNASVLAFTTRGSSQKAKKLERDSRSCVGSWDHRKLG